MRKILTLFLFCTAIAEIWAAPGDIIAQWDFASPAAAKFPLKLRGSSQFTNAGLQVNNRTPKVGQGAVTTRRYNQLTPQKAFKIDLDIALATQANIKPGTTLVLLDNKYIRMPQAQAAKRFHSGYQIALRYWGKQKFSIVSAWGFGQNSKQNYSRKIILPAGEKHRLTVKFYGNGTVEFAMDNQAAGTAQVEPGFLAVAGYPLYIGDRAGSKYMPFCGTIYQVMITELPTPQVVVHSAPNQRKVFERGEKHCGLNFELYNPAVQPKENLQLTINISGVATQNQKISTLQPAQKKAIWVDLNSYLLPGDYTIKLTLNDAAGRPIAQGEDTATIVPAYGDFMPVIMWNNWDAQDTAKVGFTHVQSYVIPWRGIYKDSQNPQLLKMLDESLKMGLYRYSCTDFRNEKNKFPRRDKQGKPYARRGIEATNPQFIKLANDLMDKVGRVRGNHPGWDGALINTEVRDGTNISFSGPEPAAFKKFSGFDIPAKVTNKYPVPNFQNPDFSWDRIVPYDAPEQVFYRWFWKNGDGWNDLHSLLSSTLHRHIKHHFFTWFDPAVRVPPIWGSGGQVDVISQWSYSYPDPIKLGQATDEVIAMAQGRPGQKVMSMTQGIWYRRAAAPSNIKVANAPDWVKKYPQAQFITIAPDCLKIALWSKISRRLDGIMYHGAHSLLGEGKGGRYRFTNAQSRLVLQDLIKNIIKPLGSLLKKIPERTPEVGILESFTANLYAPNHFSMGWSDRWIADLHLALQWSNLQPAIFYEEHFLNNSMPTLPKVLFIPGAEVLNDRIVAKLREMQKQGVILIGDEFTTPALMVDLRIKSVKRNATDPQGSKLALQQLGEKIKAQLKNHYVPPVATSNPDLVVRRRGNNQADYIFVVNDKRTFGQYVGQWKRVMEQGVANPGTITVNHSAVKAYDLVKHQEISLTTQANSTTLKVNLPPADGKLILLLDRAIARPIIKLPTLKRGKNFTIDLKIVDERNRPIPAWLPIELTLTSSTGQKLPGSGYHTLINGQLSIAEVAAPNLTPGVLNATLKCLASGKSATIQTDIL